MSIKPMKLTDASLDETTRLIEDNDWIFEQKMDGARALVVVTLTPGGNIYQFEWLASGGGALKFAAAAQHLTNLENELARIMRETGVVYAELDGELMIEDGVLRLFDAPRLTNNLFDITPNLEYLTRKHALLRMLRPSETVVAVQYAMGAELKTKMWEAINYAGVEGAVAKDIHAPYEYGVRTKRQLKLKLVKTADVVVQEINNWTSTTGSAELVVSIDPEDDPYPYVNETGRRISDDAYYGLSETRKRPFRRAPRAWLPVGSASLIGKERTIKVGSVVEINYLYWTGKAVIQPRIMRHRRPEEKTAIECTIDQFPEYSRQVVGA